MAKRKKIPPPFRVFDEEELVDWPRDTLYEYAPNMAAIDTLVAAGRKDGRPRETLKAIHELVLPQAEDGEHVTLGSPDGEVGCLPADTFASLLFQTRNIEMACADKTRQLARSNIDLVTVIGGRSPHFCTAFLGLVFSISGRDHRYPALSLMLRGGCPFHPGCTKSLTAFVPELADSEDMAKAMLPAQDRAILDTSLPDKVRLKAALTRVVRILKT